MENHFCREIYQADIRVHNLDRMLDTTALTYYIMRNLMDVRPSDTICSVHCDTVFERDLLAKMHGAHHATQAALTMAVLPIRWGSPEWERRTFGTVQLEVMPKIEDYQDRNQFEEEVRKCAKEIEGESFRVVDFHEEQERTLTKSNLINTGMYFFNAGFLMELANAITPRILNYTFPDLAFDFDMLSILDMVPEDKIDPILLQKIRQGNYPFFPDLDFGHDVLPFLAGMRDQFRNYEVDPAFVQRVRRGEYPFYAYLLSPETYWRDVGSPLDLMKANMEGLDQKFDAQLEESRFYEQMEWGWRGTIGTSIHDNATFAKPVEGSWGSIIGNHVRIESTAKVERSVILDHATVAGKVTNSIVFPGTPERSVIIGRGVDITNSILVGGELHYHGVPRSITNKVVYLTKKGGYTYDDL
jgi:NDP-sugar pyrophosphorylase family protein